MITEQDELKGVVKTYWTNIRQRIAAVEPIFAEIVDQLAPDKLFPLYLVYLPYGAIKGDTQSSYLPDGKGRYYRLTDANIPNDIRKHLGYGISGSPMGMVLEKHLEYFIDLKDKKISIPWLIYSPGQFFPMSTILGYKSNRIYAPNGLLTVSSGARSAFMLPNIGCNTHHANLQREFNIKRKAPKSLYDHWYVFKDILDKKIVFCDWHSCLIYFSENWVSKIHNDASWAKLKLYLYEKMCQKYEFERNRIYYDIIFSLIQQKRNLKPNPYLTDTARHLFTIALGVAPGYTPACNNELLPKNLIQKAYNDIYGLKKYFPTIMQPTHFKYEKDNQPIYYSLQNPSTYAFSPKSREVTSTLSNMRELEHIVSIFCEELAGESNLCSDTAMGTIAKKINFNYYHNKFDRHKIIFDSKIMPNIDPRFLEKHNLNKKMSSNFASDSPFVRGCVGFNLKD